MFERNGIQMVKYTDKTREQLLDELQKMRQRIAELEASEAERVRAEEALQASELRYRRLFESAKDGILLLDADTGHITDVNPFLMKMLHYSYEDMLGKRLWEIGAFKDSRASQNAFQKLQRDGYVRYEHLPLETKEGLHIDVEFVSNVYWVNGERVIQCNIRDITERVRAEEKLKQTVAELERTNAELERFNRLAVGRELRMIELKRQVNELSEQVGKPPPYDLSFLEESGEASTGDEA
jgi:PAS domain S-box-containing protein